VGRGLPVSSGKVSFGTSTGSGGNVEGLFGLDDREATFATDVGLIIDDRWLVRIGAFDFDTDSSVTAAFPFTVNGTPVAAGTAIQSEFGLTSLTLRAEYDLLGNVLGERGTPHTDRGTPVDIRLAATAGARLLNVDHRLAVSGGPTAEFDEWMLAGEGGGKLSIIIGPGFGRKGTFDTSVALLLGGGAGGDADLSTLDVELVIQYAVTDQFDAVFGYRQVDFDVDRDGGATPYHYSGRLAGLFIGGTIQF